MNTSKVEGTNEKYLGNRGGRRAQLGEGYYRRGNNCKIRFILAGIRY